MSTSGVHRKPPSQEARQDLAEWLEHYSVIVGTWVAIALAVVLLAVLILQ